MAKNIIHLRWEAEVRQNSMVTRARCNLRQGEESNGEYENARPELQCLRSHCRTLSVRNGVAYSNLTLTVTSRVDVVRQLGHSNLEARLDSRHHLLVAFRRHESDGKTLRTETASTTE